MQRHRPRSLRRCRRRERTLSSLVSLLPIRLRMVLQCRAAGSRALESRSYAASDARDGEQVPRNGSGHAAHIDGLLQSNLPYGVETFLTDANKCGRRRIDRRRLPPRGKRRGLPARSPRRIRFRPTGGAATDEIRLPVIFGSAAGFMYFVSITGVTGSAAPNAKLVGRGRGAIEAEHKAASGGRVWREKRRKRAGDRESRRRRGGRFVACRGDQAIAERRGRDPVDCQRRDRAGGKACPGSAAIPK